MKSLDKKKTGFRKITADDLKRGIDLSKSIYGFKVIETKSNKKKTKEPDNKVWNGKNYDSVYFKFMKKLHPGWYPNENKPKELKWIKDWKQLNPNWTEVQISFIGSLLQDLEEEIRVQQRIELLEQILNLECLKEEKLTKNIFSITQLEARNKLRNEIKEEINSITS